MSKQILKGSFLCLLASVFNLAIVAGQIVINEVCPSNISTIQNSNGMYSDWIELYNAGSSDVDLSGYGLTDDSGVPFRFKFLSEVLTPGNSVLIFASDSTSNVLVDHYEMAVDANGSWNYMPGSSSLDTNWRNLSFNDNSWYTGNGGIGFSDGDDGTIISPGVSVMMRQSFLADTSEIINAIFFMDYDDGFVAYLNGVEIARSNIGGAGSRPQWDALAKSPHEAAMYLGLSPDSFYINPVFLKSILKNGQNVLSVETHDAFTFQTDMSSNPFLIFGMKNEGLIYSATPSWFITTPSTYYNAKFKLSRAGETVYLYNSSGLLEDQVSYPAMENDNSFGRIPDGSSTWCFSDEPTPLASNNSSICYSGYASSPLFSIIAGYYNSAQNVSLSSVTPGATIRYTFNGDEPGPTSLVYSLPLNLSATTTIRASVFAPGYIQSPTVTNTYFIDQEFHLPAFCITTDSLNLWDYNTGIYVLGPNADTASPYLGANFWQDWQKPASIEYFDKDKNRIFSTNAEIEIYGNYSRYKPQKSFEIKLSDRFGTGELIYPFLHDKPFITEYDRFVLRNAGTDWNVVHFRDGLMQRLMKNTYSGYVGSEPVVMFLNGAFWGVYQFNEKHNQNWIKSNFGFEEDEINYIEQIGPSIVVNEGSDDSFIELYNYATTTSPTSSGFYEEICEDLDIPSYVDYFIAQTYYNNGDWLGEWSNNLKMWKPKTEEGKWRYILIDTDYGFGLKGSVNDNRLHMARYPIAVNPTSDIFAAVLENPKFKNYFINRYADLINTIYLPANVENVMKQFRDSMAFDMVAHFAKWGSDTIGWNARIASMMTFVNQRPAISRNYIKDEFNLTSEVVLTLDAFPAGSGRIEISTITPDIYPWSGVYFNGNPVTITAIPNPGFTFDHWGSSVIPSSDLNQRVTYNFSSDDIVTAYFTGSALPAQLTINEINYNSPEELDAHDWVELYNYGTFSLDISGWKIADEQENHKYTLPTGTVIPAGGYIVIPENAHEFSEVFPNVSNVVGQLGFNLSNGGEEIRIYDYKDSLYQFVIYGDQSPWPIEADGLGYTCELLDPNGDMNNGGNWYRGCYGGSPGAAYSSVLLTPVSISGDSVLCSGNSSQLVASINSAYNYQWSMDQNPIANATLESLSVLQSGEYKVMISVDGCSAESNEITVTEKLQVAKPEVFSSQRCGPGEVMLTASSADSILWFASQSGSVIANGSSFVTPVLTQTTTFYVQAGITCPSKTVEVVAMINDEPCDNQLSIFPNPSLGSDIILSSPKMISGIATLIVSNAEGQIVLENTLTISPEGKSNSINLSSLSSGIYFLTAYQGEEILNAKYVSLK